MVVMVAMVALIGGRTPETTHLELLFIVKVGLDIFCSLDHSNGLSMRPASDKSICKGILVPPAHRARAHVLFVSRAFRVRRVLIFGRVHAGLWIDVEQNGR